MNIYICTHTHTHTHTHIYIYIYIYTRFLNFLKAKFLEWLSKSDKFIIRK